jgi:hypothetical protein
MKICYCSSFAPWATEWFISEELEKYGKVSRYQYNATDWEHLAKRKFDIFLTSLPHHIPRDFLKEVGAFKVAHYFDIVCGWQNRERQYFPALEHFDLTFSPDDMNNEFYPPGHIWLQQGYDPGELYPVPVEKKYDVGFIGHIYGDRKEVLSKLGAEIRGTHWELHGEDFARFCSECRIMLCLNARNDVPGYWSNRIYRYLACGAFALHPRAEGIEREFADERDLVLFNDLADLENKISYYLANDKQREKIAAQGCATVVKYKWENRVKAMMEIINEARSSGIR